ncbi:Ras-related protein Rab-30 [Acropora cervicornis]|uniref:Ras-related protein Rab-30 n=1 Tax=Acropora cervicornis TaxID=6130 RepID=A0AAD9UWZ7_ACRCE|nr:Ras-related protein Rab-30 [Acropora cervicornis]
MDYRENVPLYKIVLAGDVGVGKTSIFQRYDKDRFIEHDDSTFGMDKLTKLLTVDGKQCKINVWDTAGMERTRSLTSNYYRNAHAVIFVYAIDDSYSLAVLHNWVQDVDKDAKMALKFLVGNKVDLADESSEVDKKQAELFCKNSGLHSQYHVSAKTGAGVKEMFYDIAKLMVHNTKAAHLNKDVFAIAENEDSKTTKSSNCC